MSNELVLNNLTVFEVSGKDTFTFFNNQLLSEFNHCDEVLYSAICNPKGRIIFTLLFFPHENGVKIAVNSDLSDNFYHYVSLRKFRMDLFINKTNDSIILQQDNNHQPELSSLVVSPIKANSKRNNNDIFWQLFFDLGLPWVTAHTTELFIPQHLNLDQNNIINFEKGCYPGQEIVARLHYIGKVKKRMALIQFKHNPELQAGEKTHIQELEQDVELCSPFVLIDTNWQAQAVMKSTQIIKTQ